MTDMVQSVKRREARYEKLCTTIERTQRRWEKADKAASRTMKQLVTLERQRTRMRKALDKAKVEAANAVVESVAAPVEPRVESPAMDDPNHPDLVAARELLSGINGKTKRKPKPLRDAPAEAKAMLDAAIGDDRAKRMKAMGFRPTKKKKAAEAAA